MFWCFFFQTRAHTYALFLCYLCVQMQAMHKCNHLAWRVCKMSGAVLCLHHIQGGLRGEPERSICFQSAVSTVCGTAALHHPSCLCRIVLPPPTPTHSNLIPETSGPDKPANEAFPAALSVCLRSGAPKSLNAKRRRLPRGGSHQETPIPSTPSSARSGVMISPCSKPERLTVGAVDLWIFSWRPWNETGPGELTG